MPRPLAPLLGLALALGLGIPLACSSSSPESPGSAMDAGRGDATDDRSIDAPRDVQSPAAPFTPAAMRAAADAFNAKFCPRYQACQPSIFTFYYGSMAACMEAGSLYVNAATNQGIAVRYYRDLDAGYGHGSLVTPEALTRCAAALDFSTCGKLFDFTDELVIPPECHDVFFGTLDNGSDCRTWNQCQSGRCLGSSGRPPGACGQCFSTSALGDVCRDPFTCPSGTLCSPAGNGNFTCQIPRQLGETCGPSASCHAELVCSNGQCIAPPAVCDPALGCSRIPYLETCNETTHACEPTPLAPLGAPCGFVPVQPSQPPAEVRCAPGGTCAVASDIDAGVDDAGQPILTFTCQPLIEDGMPCNPAYPVDFPCKTPDSLCYQNICQRHGPEACPAPVVPP